MRDLSAAGIGVDCMYIDAVIQHNKRSTLAPVLGASLNRLFDESDMHATNIPCSAGNFDRP